MSSNDIYLNLNLSFFISARRLEDPSATKTRTFELYEDIVKKVLGNTPLGMVWLPGNKVFLGREAGQAVRFILTQPRRAVGAEAEGPALRTPLLELAFFLSHKLSDSVGSTREYLLGEDPSVDHVLRIFWRCRSTSITALRTLFDSGLL